MIVLAAFLIWIAAVTYLLYLYGIPLSYGIVDSTLATLLIIGGWLLLENIFLFYSPKKSNFWMILVLPIVLGVPITLVLNMVLHFLIENTVYHTFLSEALAVRGAMVFVLLTAFTIIAVIYNRLEDQLKSREREEVALKMSREAELYHLRSQLQPHFLFNSLNSINALMISKPDKAREMVFQLSDFLRGTIRKGAEQWVDFSEELKTLKLYLEIEKVRFGHRLQITVNSLPETDGFQLPALILQPLVENAVKFGLYGMVGEVTISIDAVSKGGSLYVVICNPYDPTDHSPQGSGFGLNAVRRRLYLLFGRHDLVRTETIDNIFTVTLTIPQLR